MIIQFDFEQKSFLTGVLEQARRRIESSTAASGRPQLCLGPLKWPRDGVVRETTRVRLNHARVEIREIDVVNDFRVFFGPNVSVARVQLVVDATIEGQTLAALRDLDEDEGRSEEIDVELRFDLSVTRMVAPGSANNGLPCLSAVFAELTPTAVARKLLTPEQLKAAMTGLVTVANGMAPALKGAIPCTPIALADFKDLIGVTDPTSWVLGGVGTNENAISIRVEFPSVSSVLDWKRFFRGETNVLISDKPLPDLGFGGLRILVDTAGIAANIQKRILAETSKKDELSSVSVSAHWESGPTLKVRLSGRARAGAGGIACAIDFDAETTIEFRVESPTVLLIRTAQVVDMDNWDVLACSAVAGLVFSFVEMVMGVFVAGPTGAIVGAVIGMFQGMFLVIGAANSMTPTTGDPLPSSPAPPSSGAGPKRFAFVTTCEEVDDDDADQAFDCRLTLTEVDASPGSATPSAMGRFELKACNLFSGAISFEGRLLDEPVLQPGPALLTRLTEPADWDFDPDTLCEIGAERTFAGGKGRFVVPPNFLCTGEVKFRNANAASSSMLVCSITIAEDPLLVFQPRVSGAANQVVTVSYDPVSQTGSVNLRLFSSSVPAAFKSSPYPLRVILRTTGGVRFLRLDVPVLDEARLLASLPARQKLVCRPPDKPVPAGKAPGATAGLGLPGRDVIPVGGAGPRPTPLGGNRVSGGPTLAFALLGVAGVSRRDRIR